MKQQEEPVTLFLLYGRRKNNSSFTSEHLSGCEIETKLISIRT